MADRAPTLNTARLLDRAASLGRKFHTLTERGKKELNVGQSVSLQPVVTGARDGTGGGTDPSPPNNFDVEAWSPQYFDGGQGTRPSGNFWLLQALLGLKQCHVVQLTLGMPFAYATPG